MDLKQIAIEQSQMICSIFGEGDKKRDATLSEPEGVGTFYNLEYDEHNRLDIYFPERNKEKLPVIVNVHGGAYVYGTKENYKYYGMFMAKQGFIFVNANYRLAPEHKFPTQLEEICHVFQWMEKNQEIYLMDLDNVFITGDSAGAQIASHLGAIYANMEFASRFSFEIPAGIKIRAMALNCGMYDLLYLTKEPRNIKDEFMDNYVLMEIYLGEEGRKQEEKLDVYSNINANYPSCFVMTSYYDFLRDYARPFYELLLKKNVEAEYRLYGDEGQKNMGHVFHCNMNLNEAELCNMDECNFFKKYYK